MSHQKNTNFIIGDWSPFKQLTEEDNIVWNEVKKSFDHFDKPYEVSKKILDGMKYRFRCTSKIYGYIIVEVNGRFNRNKIFDVMNISISQVMILLINIISMI
ncbi:hypothetical protein [Tenacibaculum sp. C7A-26P2]|uniref:hypothetical protein n=1 Tax=Tenacibaculum sp. C7A-26P2 TaxID=3447504 RepID=UPI003F84F611